MKKIVILGFMLLTMLGTRAMGQEEITVRGTVTDASDGTTLPGVTITVQGTTVGATTDNEGNYQLQNVPEDAVLVFSFVGMVTEEVPVEGRSVINVEMESALVDLEEMVVVGYGVQQKSVVTAAISSVSAEDIGRSRSTRVEDVLRGQASGISITQSSGQPGDDAQVNIRGIGTINHGDPLYIVDGMALEGGLGNLNPADIESIEVLKDAASAAVYGARAANGVILITTKSGEEGEIQVDYEFSQGFQNPWRKRDVLNATEYMVIMNEMELNDGNAPRYTQEEITQAGEGTDWQDETFNYNAPVQNHQISASGGTERGTYYMAFGYYNDEGIVAGDVGKSNYERYNIRLNNRYDVFRADRDYLNRLTVGINAGYTRALSSGIVTNTEYGSILGSALAFNPTKPVYAEDEATEQEILDRYPNAVRDDEGNLFSIPPSGFQEISNPVAMLHAPTGNQTNEDKIISNMYGELELYEGLTFRSSYGVDLAFWGWDAYAFEYFTAVQGGHNTRSDVHANKNRGFKWQVENVLTYDTSFDDIHQLTVMLGQSAEKYTFSNVGGSNYDLLERDPDRAIIDYGIADPDDQTVYGGTGGFDAQTLASYFGRISYNYDRKYLFQATIRRDGASTFGPENKWALFPSLSAGWIITEEDFMAESPDWLDNIKLRGSWGRNGNHQIEMFGYTSLMAGNQNYYFGSGDHREMQYGTSPARIPNPHLKWEESEQIDIGIEMLLLEGAIALDADYFQKKTDGMLMEQPIPTYVGFQPPLGNTGEMLNSGYEFTLGYRGDTRDFSYNISANATYLENELIDMGNEEGEAIFQTAGAAGIGEFVKGQNGMPFPFFYGYKTDGILQNQEEADEYNATYGENARPGDVRFVDINGDGSIDGDDRTKIGKGMPDWSFGLRMSAQWRNFDAYAFFQGTYGNDIFDLAQRGDIPAMNRPSWVLDRWIGENTSDEIPRMTRENPNRNWRSSDLYIKDGSFVRLRNLQIGYTLPENLVQRAAIQNVRIYVMAENLLTFTAYDGFEPEVASGGITTLGIDRGVYPQARTISLGANISL